jgi:hypothetical protein
MWTSYYSYLPAVAGPTHRASGWHTVAVVLVYLAGQGALVALITWYAVWLGREDRHRRPRRIRRRDRDLAAELAEIDESLTRLWDDEVGAGRRRADREARRLVSQSIPVVDVRVTARRFGQSCTQLTFADGTTLVLWSTEPSCERTLRRLPWHAVLQYVPQAGSDSFVLGTDATSIVVSGDLLAVRAE